MKPTYNSVTATSAVGNIYPLLGGGTSPASGAACTIGSATVSLDTWAAHKWPLRSRRITAQTGSIYSIAGGGTTSTTTAPLLGKSALIDTNAFKVATDNSGNIYIGDNTFVLFYDIRSGYIRRLITNGAVCAGATDSPGDGCPATQATFGGSNGLGVAVNGVGDLFMADTTNSRIRRVAAGSLLPSDAAGAVATTIGTGLKPTALATDGNGNLFTYDLTIRPTCQRACLEGSNAVADS